VLAAGALVGGAGSVGAGGVAGGAARAATGAEDGAAGIVGAVVWRGLTLGVLVSAVVTTDAGVCGASVVALLAGVGAALCGVGEPAG
jgi:hypothetical protein